MEILDFIINGGETRRFHTWPVLRQQTDAEHSFHVAMLIYVLAGREEPGIRPALLMAALCHDLAEHKVGDTPSPAKRDMDKYFVTYEKETMSMIPFRKAWGQMEEKILSEHQLDWLDCLEPHEVRLLKLADIMQGALYCIRERMMGNRLITTPYNNFRRYIGEIIAPRPDETVARKLPEHEVLDYIDDMWEQANV